MRLFSLVFLLVINGGNVFSQLTPSDEHSKIIFHIKNLGFATSGTFSGLAGTIYFDPEKPAATSFDVTVKSASVNTDNSLRDSHLRGENYFDVAHFPVIRLQSVSVAKKTGNNWIVNGRLTIKGIVKEISFPFTAEPAGDNFLFKGQFRINRKDFHIGGASPISDELEVDLTVQTIKP
jgi:polyisoprenoid-binding protein YceI